MKNGDPNNDGTNGGDTLRLTKGLDRLDPLLTSVEHVLDGLTMTEVCWLQKQIDRMFHERFRRWVRGANE